MALQKSDIPLRFVDGVDSRVDERSLQPPKWATLNNCVFDTPTSLSRRNGFVNLAPDETFSTIRGLASRNNELMISTDAGVLSYIPQEQSVKGIIGARYPSAAIRSNSVFNQIANPLFGAANSTAIPGPATISFIAMGYWVVCHSATGDNTTWVYIIDPDTSSIAHSETITGHSAQVFPDGSILTVSSGVIRQYLVGPGVSGPSVGGPFTLVSDVGANEAFDADRADGSSDIYLAYGSSTANTIKYGRLSGSYTQLGTQATASSAVSIGVAVSPSPFNFIIGWSMEGATNRVDARTFTSAGAAISSVVTASSGVTGGTTWRGVTAAWTSATSGVLFFQHVLASGRSGVYSDDFVSTTGPQGAPALSFPGSRLVSRALRASAFPPDTVGVVVASLSSSGQNSYYLSIGRKLEGFATVGMFAPAEASSTAYSRHTLFGVDVDNVDSTATFALLRSSTNTPYRLGSFSVTFNDKDLNAAAQVADNLFFPGGTVVAYDGASLHEQSILRYPEFGSATSQTGGGLLPSTNYHYTLTYEMLSATGDLIQSASVEDISVTTGASDGTVRIAAPIIPFTLSPISVQYSRSLFCSVWRRAQGGTIYHRVTSRDFTSALFNPIGVGGGTDETNDIFDTMAEATLTTQEVLPLSQGVVDNIPPPACNIITQGNGRIFLSGFDDPDLIWYSKLRGTGEWLHFSDINTIVVESGAGPITALGCVQDSLIIFRENEIYICGGEGLNNTGTEGSFTTPRLVTSGLGCIEPRSVITAGGKLFFKSKKGIYSLTAGGELNFVGSPVANYASLSVTSSVALPQVNQVRFTTSSRILVYDYELNRWTTFTLSVGSGGALDSCVWAGKHVVQCGATGPILAETEGVYTDNGVAFDTTIETPWIKPAGTQGKARFYEATFLTDSTGAISMDVDVAYDFSAFYGETHTWVTSASTPQFKVRPNQQKCEAFKLRITVQGDTSNTNVTFNEISLTVGLRGPSVELGTTRRAS